MKDYIKSRWFRFINWFKSSHKKPLKPVVAVNAGLPNSSHIVRNIALIVGHNKSAQGAKNYLGETEFSFNSRIAKKLKKALAGIYEVEIIFRNTKSYYSQCVNAAQSAKNFGADLAICMHFNAFNGKTQGCEVLIMDTESPIDNKIADIMTDMLECEYGFTERGVDGVRTIQSGHRGSTMLEQLRRYNVPAILIEPMFADDKRSGQVFNDEERYVNILARSVIGSLS